MLTPQITLSQHTLGSDDVTLAQDEFLVTDLTGEIPQWHRFVTFDSPDEVFIQFLLPGGLGLGAVVSPNVAMPFRMRMREVGASTWINFPEFHLGGNALRQTRRQIRLRWGVTMLDRSQFRQPTVGSICAIIRLRNRLPPLVLALGSRTVISILEVAMIMPMPELK